MNTIPQTVAASSATADIAYYVCVVSFFIAGGVAIYLLWDRIQRHNVKASRSKVVRPSKKRVAAKKTAAKKAPAKKTATKKSAKRPTKKK
jgi:hypothetical protein